MLLFISHTVGLSKSCKHGQKEEQAYNKEAIYIHKIGG